MPRLLVHTAKIDALAPPASSGARSTPSKGRALVGDAAEIELDEALEQAAGAGLVQRLAGGGEAALDHHLGSTARPASGGLDRQGRQPLFGQHGVERAHQVGRCVHQGAVQVEGDHAAFQPAQGKERSWRVSVVESIGGLG